MDGNITSAGTLSGTLTAEQTLSGGITRAEREIVGVLDVEVDGVSVVTDSVASIDLTGKADVSSLATVATTGDYDDLTGKPTIPSKTSDLTNDSGFITSVEVDSVSVVTDGVAEIPIANTTGVKGVIGVSNVYQRSQTETSSYNTIKLSYSTSSGTASTNLAHTDIATTAKRGLMSSVDKTKLDGIASGAEVNVQSDWSQSDSTADDYIKNKPTIPSKTSDLTNDSGFITGYTETDPVFAASAAHGIASSDITAWNGKQDALVSGTNIKTINNESILGSGNITIQGGGGGVTDVEIDETSIVTDGVAEIPHATNNTYGVVKATNIVAGNPSTGETYNYGQITYGSDSDLKLATTALATTSKRGLMSKDDKTKLDAIATGAEVNVQSDWNESDSTSDAYIANKPTIPTVPTNVSAFTNDAGYLTSYTETDPTVPSWAKASSKPSYTFSEIGTTPTSISGYGITDAYTKSEIDGLVSGVLHYKGTKATTSALPSSGNTTGDVWHVTADGSEWAWDGTQWQELGTAVDLSGYVPTSRTVNGKALSNNISLTASDVSALPSSTVIPTITDTYSGTSSNGMSGKAVKSAIDALDGTVTGTAGADKTLTAFSQTDGKVSATFGNISITKSQISDFPTLATVATSGSYNDLSNKPTIPAKNIWYATCSSAADTVAKEATSAGGNFVLATGNMVRVLFAYGNTATGATLSIDGCTATGIYRDGNANTSKYMWANSEVVDLVYDGGKFIMSDGSAATTSTYGVTKLNSATDSESTTEAATPSAVKAAYDHGGVTSVNGSTGAVTVSVPVTDVTVGGTSVVSSGTAAIPSIPTVNNATLTIQKNGTTVNTFTANASSNVTANITVPTTAADVSAIPTSAKGAASGVCPLDANGKIDASYLPTYNGGVQ